MSLKKGITRRFSLLASSSFVAAGLSVLAFGSVALTPTFALAANECGDPTTNGTAADTFTCTGVIPSITYPATSGNLTLLTTSTLAVSGGLAVTPTLANSVTIRSSEQSATATITNGAGPAINVERTAGGAINLGGSFNSQPLGVIATGTTAGIRLRNVGTGATVVHLWETSVLSATAGAGLDLATTGTGNYQIRNRGQITGTTAAILIGGGTTVTLVNENIAVIDGRVVSSNSGATTFTNSNVWRFSGASTLSATTTLTATLTNAGLLVGEGAADLISFGSGTGVFIQGGYFISGGTPGASSFTLQGVDTWNNTGVVVFGLGDVVESDRETNDRIVLTNSTAATFTGGVGSQLSMDVDFTASQATCAVALTADCLDLRGHNTAGTTAVLVTPVATGFTAERIVMVDASGAGNDAGVFTLSDASPGYRALGDGMVDTGLFLYELTHDTTAKQHVLTVAAVDQEAVELNLAARSALPAWEAATGSWFDRQADLRNTLRGLDGGVSPGAWLRVAGSYANEKKVSALEIGGDSIDVVTSNTQDTLALVGGVDVVGSVGDGGGWVAGVTVGKVTSELGFKENPNGFEFDGHSLGAYASYASPSFFIDAIVNTTTLDATYTGASLGMSLEGEAQSTGYRIDGGWRFDWGDGIWFEPLAALSHVTTDLGDMAVATGVAAEFDEMTSFRGSLGARLSGDIEFDGFSLQLSGTGRVWREFEGESASAVTTGFGDFTFADQAEETFGEVGVSLALFGAGGRLSAQLGTGVEFREGYQSVDVALGGRYQW